MKNWFRLMMLLSVIAIVIGSVSAFIVTSDVPMVTRHTSTRANSNIEAIVPLHMDSIAAIVLYNNTTSYAFVEMLDSTECYCTVRTAIRLNAAISGTSDARFEILVNSDGEREIVVKKD